MINFCWHEFYKKNSNIFYQKITFSGNLLPKNGFFRVDESPLLGAFCCQVRKDLSITDAHASSSELQFPNKFIRIRKEKCNRIFKNKKCYPGRIWSPSFPLGATRFAVRDAMRCCPRLGD